MLASPWVPVAPQHPKGAPKPPYRPDCDCCKTHRRKLGWRETTQRQWEARGKNGVTQGQRVLLTRLADGRRAAPARGVPGQAAQIALTQQRPPSGAGEAQRAPRRVQPPLGALPPARGHAGVVAWLVRLRCGRWRCVSARRVPPAMGVRAQDARLTDAFGQAVAPLGSPRCAVVAGEEPGARQHVALIADEAHGGPHWEFGAGDHPAAVLGVPGVPAGGDCGL